MDHVGKVRGSATLAKRSTLLACVALLLLSARIAGAGAWTSKGPLGGNGTALAVDPTTPTTVYAGTSGGGLFKSTDGGVTWSAINGGVPSVGSWTVESLVV